MFRTVNYTGKLTAVYLKKLEKEIRKKTCLWSLDSEYYRAIGVLTYVKSFFNSYKSNLDAKNVILFNNLINVCDSIKIKHDRIVTNRKYDFTLYLPFFAFGTSLLIALIGTANLFSSAYKTTGGDCIIQNDKLSSFGVYISRTFLELSPFIAIPLFILLMTFFKPNLYVWIYNLYHKKFGKNRIEVIKAKKRVSLKYFVISLIVSAVLVIEAIFFYWLI